jgi:hypothetical protein
VWHRDRRHRHAIGLNQRDEVANRDGQAGIGFRCGWHVITQQPKVSNDGVVPRQDDRAAPRDATHLGDASCQIGPVMNSQNRQDRVDRASAQRQSFCWALHGRCCTYRPLADHYLAGFDRHDGLRRFVGPRVTLATASSRSPARVPPRRNMHESNMEGHQQSCVFLLSINRFRMTSFVPVGALVPAGRGSEPVTAAIPR